MLYVALSLLSTGATANQTINLSVTTHLGDTQSFREGDMVSFYIGLEKDAYVTIVYQDASDRLSVLLPNALHPNSFFQAGLFIPIPDDRNPFQFRITAPFGTETLWVFASDKPLPPLSSSGTTSLTDTISSLRNSLKEHCRKNKALFEEASLSIKTTAASSSPLP